VPNGCGVVIASTSLTADEQRRFEAGREIYRNICQSCHQPDGRGQDRVAPGLVGSPLLLAAAGVPTRILLNGKDGKIGLMPPIGFVLRSGIAVLMLAIALAARFVAPRGASPLLMTANIGLGFVLLIWYVRE